MSYAVAAAEKPSLNICYSWHPVCIANVKKSTAVTNRSVSNLLTGFFLPQLFISRTKTVYSIVLSVDRVLNPGWGCVGSTSDWSAAVNWKCRVCSGWSVPREILTAVRHTAVNGSTGTMYGSFMKLGYVSTDCLRKSHDYFSEINIYHWR